MENNLDIDLLVQLVQSVSCLYSKKDKGYKDLIKKENCWNQIAETLQSTPKICEETFKKLKERFIRERKALRKSRTGEGAKDNSSHWVWYSDMNFLDEHVQERRRTHTNIKTKPCASTLATYDSQLSDMYEDSQSLDHGTEDLELAENEELESATCQNSTFMASPRYNNNLTAAPSTSTANIEVTPSRLPKKNDSSDRPKGEKRPTSNDVDLQILRTLDTIRNGNQKGNMTEQVFGNLVAAELAAVNEPERKRRIKKQILDVLFNDNI